MQSSIDSTYQSVIEQSGIRAGDGGFAVTVAADTTLRTGDKANGIAGIFDAGKVQKEIAAQSQITQTFSTLAPKQLAAYVSDQVNEINAQLGKEDDPQRRAALLAERDRWDEGGAYRVLMHTAVGSVVGDVSGAAGAAAAAVPAPGLNDLQASLEDSLVKAGMNPTVAKGVAVNVSGLAAAGVGAAVGGATGAGVGLSVDANNRQRHLSTCERLKEGCKGRASSECQTINRIGGVRSGMPTDDAQIPASKVVENYDAIGKVVSYTLIDRKTNQPTMIMELLEFNAYRNATPRIQATSSEHSSMWRSG